MSHIFQYKSAEDTTFECYYADTAKPLNDVGISNIFKRTTSAEEAAVVLQCPAPFSHYAFNLNPFRQGAA